ncbi:MAG: FAD-dependent oxidoreductase [Rhodospirillaceae bacterium]|jgi:pyruvate/2-oxoglutarate dehydrogenase complex dihydrolipoamide dehydrogenase (E3) component|nr:FAD-dependent oxidoreductase [Rhodospirillaceae bacterium]MBT6119608.1 FAD-dependent oxidoreductase [Rhodospirillaceae bacterium]
MAEILKPDLCVIGAGSAGLSVAAGASQMGASVVLVEKGAMGGDCLNVGCVPSKAMLAAGHAAQAMRSADRFGLGAREPEVDFAAMRDRVQGVIAAIAPMDSVARFEGFGVTVLQDAACFTGPREVVAGDATIRARRFVLATGSTPLVPPIPGLDATPHFTNETIFENGVRPDHLLVIGGGPIGCELAQAHRRLGAAVTLVEMATIMPKDDPELVEVVRDRLLAEGVALREGVKVVAVEARGPGVAVALEAADGGREWLEGSHLLIAVGRKATVEGLGLDEAGIEHSPRGVAVDDRLRTTNRHVFAIGDCIGGLQFTHMASHHAGVVIKNALFRWPAKTPAKAFPWVTYTDPELAHVGLSEAAAREAGESVTILRWAFAENDRAQAERETEGLVKVVVTAKGRILGATIVGRQAGELIQIWVLAISNGLKIGAVAQAIAPYPTLGEASKRAAGTYYTPKLFSERTRKIVRFLAKFG